MWMKRINSDSLVWMFIVLCGISPVIVVPVKFGLLTWSAIEFVIGIAIVGTVGAFILSRRQFRTP